MTHIEKQINALTRTIYDVNKVKDEIQNPYQKAHLEGYILAMQHVIEALEGQFGKSIQPEAGNIIKPFNND
jgi:uncharacterized protein YaaN involved in tellurite resistance